jgi:AbiV family abortive infection protein
MATLSARYLLQGMWYALEQSGHLLSDAIFLYDRGSHPTAVGVAMLAREELGKALILRQLAEDARAGRAVTHERLGAELEGHITKQRSAKLTVTVRVTGGLSDLLRRTTLENLEETTDQFNEVLNQVARRAPGERHELRQQSFYVDPDRAGEGWSRPEEIPKAEAHEQIFQALWDYTVLKKELRTCAECLALQQELESWSDRPALPDPPWP